MNSALLIILGTAAGALVLGVLARRGLRMDLEQWSVGGRGFGSLLMFLLTAGEIYTTFSFLGASGWAYGHGGAAYYILCYLPLSMIFYYVLAPPVWRIARAARLMSQPHFFVHQYGSRALGLLVALVGVAALVPYLVLQLKGLGIIVSLASYGAISASAAVWIGAAVVTAYVMVSGVHGAAWNAVVKDGMILAIAVFLGIYLPIHYYGGHGPMFARIEAVRHGFLALPAHGYNVLWFQTTVLLQAAGVVAWPHNFAAIFAARDERNFRRNAMIMPLYSLMLLFVFFAGFAAIGQVPGLQGPDIDLALLKIAIKTFDPWFVGVIGAAGLLTALVPGALLLITASTVLANDLWRGCVRPGASDAATGQVARWLVPCVTLVAVGLTLRGGTTLVALLLMGYSVISQLLPALVGSLLPRNPVSAPGAICGIFCGVGAVMAMSLGGGVTATLPFLPGWLADMNTGLAALVLNVAVTAVVSKATRPRAAAELAAD